MKKDWVRHWVRILCWCVYVRVIAYIQSNIQPSQNSSSNSCSCTSSFWLYFPNYYTLLFNFIHLNLFSIQMFMVAYCTNGDPLTISGTVSTLEHQLYNLLIDIVVNWSNIFVHDARLCRINVRNCPGRDRRMDKWPQGKSAFQSD